MASTPGRVGPRKEEAIVYFVVSPAVGRGQRIYTDEDIQALGGIRTIEQHLEKESYWYVRLGKIPICHWECLAANSSLAGRCSVLPMICFCCLRTA